MEKKIRAYEKFIAREVGREMSDTTRAKLARFHCEMVMNFQHERLIHLIVTLFFVALSMAMILVMSWAVVNYGLMLEMMPLYLLVLILVILSVCYVRHYYFLENHVQGLYKYTEKLKGF